MGVFCRSGRRLEISLPSYRATSLADGTFRVSGLHEGDYRVDVRHPAFTAARESSKVTIGDGESAFLEIGVRRAGGLRGEIENLSKRTNLQQHLVLERTDEQGEETRVLAIGHATDLYSADAVSPGVYDVHLTEVVLGPHVDEDATAFRAEDTVERTTYLGQVVIRPGETTVFDTEVPADRE